MEQMSDKAKKAENDDINSCFEKFVKWSKICIITAIIIGVFGIGACILAVLKEFTDLAEKAPFLYGKTIVWILVAVCLALLASEIFCYVKARKYKKQIEISDDKENDDETDER